MSVSVMSVSRVGEVNHGSCSSLFTAMGKKLCLSLLVQALMTLSLPEGIESVQGGWGHSGSLWPIGGDGWSRSPLSGESMNH